MEHAANEGSGAQDKKGWQDIAKAAVNFDLQQTLTGLDWVLICINEGNAHRYPFGFDDQVLNQFYRPTQ